jgi:hypothetical protein
LALSTGGANAGIGFFGEIRSTLGIKYHAGPGNRQWIISSRSLLIQTGNGSFYNGFREKIIMIRLIKGGDANLTAMAR